jgi:hypothetical protein
MCVGHRIVCTLLAMACTGCCTFNACVPDLAFTSLTRPAPSEVQDANVRDDLWRLRFRPSELKLRFSTQRDLFRLQERNYAFGERITMTLCDDKSGFVSFGGVYMADYLSYDNKYTGHVATMNDPQLPPMPSLSRAADGRITYETSIRIDSVMHIVRDPRFGGMMGQFTPLPSDPHQLPDLCFSIGGGVFTTTWGSNTVALPREAVISVLGGSESGRDIQ